MPSRRRFLAALAAAGLTTGTARAGGEASLAPAAFGNISLLHIGDTRASMHPAYYRETAEHVGLGRDANRPPYVTGEHLLEHYRVMPQTLEAHALTALNFANLAERYGPLGGYANLASVLRELRAARPDALLLATGDCLLGSAMALRTGSADAVEAFALLGVDATTLGSELELGLPRLNEIFGQSLSGKTALLASPLPAERKSAFGDARLPWTIYFAGGIPVGVVGQAAPPRLPNANGRRQPLDEARLQMQVDAARAAGARVVVLLSQAGLAANLKLASRLRGLDVLFSGGSFDILPEPIVVGGKNTRTLVASVGGYGKFCGALDLDVRNGKVRDFRYQLVPVSARLTREDAQMANTIRRHEATHHGELSEVLATNRALLWRRGLFASSTDQLIADAVRRQTGAEIVLLPGYRHGTTLLPEMPVTRGWLIEQLADGPPDVTLETWTGAQLRHKLEDALEATFAADPYERHGQDMWRASGLRYTCNPTEPKGRRILSLDISEVSRVKVATWGLAHSAEAERIPLLPLVSAYLKALGEVPPISPESPLVKGLDGNRGWRA